MTNSDSQQQAANNVGPILAPNTRALHLKLMGLDAHTSVLIGPIKHRVQKELDARAKAHPTSIPGSPRPWAELLRA